MEEIKIIDSELSLLVNDTESSKHKRIEINNSWPKENKFEIENIYHSKTFKTGNNRRLCTSQFKVFE